jgi:two-component system, OmpR family, phosphate regulon sensor histidine kinase PhoR
MALVTFILGLAVGIGLYLWQSVGFRHQVKDLLAELQVSSLKDGLSLWAQLRRKLLQHQQREQELEVELQTWKQVLQLAPIGYLQVDDENQLDWCNPEARSLLKIENWNAEEPRLLLKVVRSYDLDRLIELARESQQPTTREWLFHWSNEDLEHPERDRALTLFGHAFPLANGNVGVFLENRQPAIELAQTRDRWMSDLTHELRTPLTSIRLVAEALESRVEPPMKTWVERMLREVHRLICLVEDWLELSKINTDRDRTLQYARLELEPLVESVWQTLEPLASAKQVALAYRAAEPLYLEADESRLFRVLLNVLDNAVRYSPLESIVRVEAAYRSPDVLRIEIIDAGSGFAAADLPHVFDRLYRGDLSRQRNSAALSAITSQSIASGSGLGLAIVQQIILAYSGSVTANNHPETGGAWIQIELPVSRGS